MVRSFGGTVASVVLAGALVAACASSHPGQGVGGPTVTGPRSPAEPLYPTATTGTTPDATQTAELVTKLSAVDPALVSDPQKAVRAAVVLCAQLQNGDDKTTLVPAAFSNLKLSSDQVTAVITAVQSSFCPA